MSSAKDARPRFVGSAVLALADRSADWVDQALRDLEQAEHSMQADRHEWACFATHQAVEKALKGLNAARSAWRWLIRGPADLLGRARIRCLRDRAIDRDLGDQLLMAPLA